MIEHWSEGIADDNMAEDILVELGDVVRRHPWWRARAALTLRLLSDLGIEPPARVLDAGCGWGVTLDALEAQGYRAVGMDVSRRTLEHLDRPGRTLIEADLTQPLRADAPRYDAVLALDVIEHLDDDREAVRRLGALLEPGGALVVSVPALPAMFSEFDAVQGHRRRYLPDTLAAAFDDSGLRLDRTFWWGRWLVPLLRRQRARTLSRPGETPAQIYQRHLTLPPKAVSWLLSLAFRLEEKSALRGSLGSGTSLFAVARRS
ncbi:MAG: class I SAM-dependent methyltransferase [Paludisphaera borealis]|uniref:class I SAM-dependent methyltransferase n=1 Tax=Paludisphaera borealis TaxID=1387353 RepID=UPI00284EA349|nr:class I SAM-dependent methyltransferase [Paludisphaera borealis]MDR3621597.1 class I SAM-dependent methyltransferase [Paludisphaera borealis]